jgi:hypothetical protein
MPLESYLNRPEPGRMSKVTEEPIHKQPIKAICGSSNPNPNLFSMPLESSMNRLEPD